MKALVALLLLPLLDAFQPAATQFASASVSRLEPVLRAGIVYAPHTPHLRNGLHQPLPDSIDLHLHMYQERLSFSLSVADWLYAPNSYTEFHKLDGSTERIPNRLQGYHVDTPTGWVALTVHHGDQLSVVLSHEGFMYKVEPMSRHEIQGEMADQLHAASQHSGYVAYSMEHRTDHKNTYCGSAGAERRDHLEPVPAVPAQTTLQARRLLAVDPWTGCYPGMPVLPDSTVLNFGIATDHLVFARLGGDLSLVQSFVAEMLLNVNMVYRAQPNVVLALVEHLVYESQSATPTWNDLTSPSSTGCSELLNNTLSAFGQWRNARSPHNAGLWSLLTACDFATSESGAVGLGFHAVLCSKAGGASVTQFWGPNTWTTLAHEIGHNFGAGHSFENGIRSTGGIMDYGDGTLDGEYQFQGAREAEICAEIATMRSQCDAFGQVGCAACWGPELSPSCGNGILEQGEQCDVDSACCDIATCTLKAGAQCSAGDCCNLATCHFLPVSTTCGFDGNSGYCANGLCDTRAIACNAAFGWRFCGTKAGSPCTLMCQSDAANCAICDDGNNLQAAHHRDKCGEGERASLPNCWSQCNEQPLGGTAPNGTVCGTHSDGIHQKVCDAGSCVESAAPSCDDGIFNGDEDDTDCGGGSCPPCDSCAAGTGNCEPSNRDCETDLLANSNHCGLCDNACAAGRTCVGGSCQCVANFDNCDTSSDDCEADLRTTSNCGACGVVCGNNTQCQDGTCVCAGGFGDCSPMDVGQGGGNGCETDVQSDPFHCGNCSNSCGVCQFGSCGSCPAGQAACGAPCEDILSNPNNCGGCGVDCGPNSACASGSCFCDQPAVFGDCSAEVPGCETDLRATAQHCGACDSPCGPGAVCLASACECPSGLADCDGDRDLPAGTGCETDTTNNMTHCGVCGNNCPDNTTCSASACQCVTGQGDCDGDSLNGCEVTLSHNASHCGACGRSCRAGQICSESVCECDANLFDCDFQASNGCETDIRSTPHHCGGCEQSCRSNALCVDSACECMASFADCDGDLQPGALGTGCETDLRVDSSHCGVCGNDCGSNSVCNNTLCGCALGFGDCNNDQTDGCEVDLETDRQHCSACDSACPDSLVCVAGDCVCATGWGDCDADPSLCETPTHNDTSNCGGCGAVCPLLVACAEGVCGGCLNNSLNCDQNNTNGCEVDSLTDNQHCGACDVQCGVHQTCVSGNCTCNVDWEDCDSDGLSCEADLTSASTCGACDAACFANQQCDGGGVCSCQDGYSDCDQLLNTGCEADLMNDATSCGQCNMSCVGVNEECSGGLCQCMSGFGNCSGSGCPTDISSTPQHCGACGNACGANGDCQSGQCVCIPDFGNCNGNWTDGCERAIFDDNEHCGACHMACGLNSTCLGHQCVCDSGTYDCDGEVANGCEATSICPTPAPTLTPTSQPTPAPTSFPTTHSPTASPTPPPTLSPTRAPSSQPTTLLTSAPSSSSQAREAGLFQKTVPLGGLAVPVWLLAGIGVFMMLIVCLIIGVVCKNQQEDSRQRTVGWLSNEAKADVEMEPLSVDEDSISVESVSL